MHAESRSANLELKARDPDPNRTLAAARALGAEDRGRFFQRDTFFQVPMGRLKLREEAGRAELIHYVRPNEPGPRASSYLRAFLDDPSTLRDLLAEALGVAAVVEKHRHLLVKENVRIHLDEVRGLGSFVELEAVVPLRAPPGAELERVTSLMQALGIAEDRLVAGSYADAVPAPASSD